MKPRKAILYIRVSTDEQAEKGHSLAHQDEMLRRYCVINNIEIVAFFKEDYSAKTFARPEFKKLLEFQKRKGGADLLLFLKWDRFSRNAPEAYMMISKLNKLGIEPQAIEQPLNMEIPEQKFLLALYLTAPEVENDRRSLNILAGMRKAMKEGRYMGTASYGYKHGRTESNKPTIVPSAEKDMVLLSYQMMATGNYHIEDLRKLLNKKGMRLGRTQFWYMLRNPTYIGKVVVPAYKNEPAEIKDAVHEALIPKALYYEVQDVLDGRKRKHPKIPFCKKEELPLRGFLQCAQCGRPLTGSSSKGRSLRYHYYHCKFGCKERFKAEDANEVFYQVLRAISENDRIYRSFQRIMGNLNNKNGKEQVAELQTMKKELATYQNRLTKAQTLMLDDQLDIHEYHSLKSRLEQEIERLTVKISAIDVKGTDETELIEFGFYFLANLDKLFAVADLDVKRTIIGSTFPEKLIYEKNTYRTASDENILLLLAATGKDSSQKKESRQENSRLLSGRVVWAGIEPATHGFSVHCSTD